MKVPLSWINEFLENPITAKEASERLTLLGIEVEKIDQIVLAFEGVIVGKVRSAVQHPNADRLRVATVFDGTMEHQVVCGAPNCRAGIAVAFAPIGAVLKDKEGKPWKIKRGKLRDVESFGMLCSEEELGLPTTVAGSIIELSSDWQAGADLAKILSASPEAILEISLTPNLGHCMHVLGIARELSASLGVLAKRPDAIFRASPEVPFSLSISIEDPALCPRYCCRFLQNVSVGPSPDWLKNKLEKCGLRSINNVVDIANFVMMEIGQPLHIFDADSIAGGKIVVTSQSPYKSLQTLDGKEREIPPGTLLICDAKKPLAIAGIMGGLASSATESTKNIVIEAALFSPSAVRRSSRLLEIKTDSSSRFDKGIDPNLAPFALNYAASLIQQIAGGQVAAEAIDIHQGPFHPKTIVCRKQRVNELLGTDLSLSEISDCLNRLEMKCRPRGNEELQVEVPTYRNDILREIDLVEEVARIFGYNNIVRKNPLHVSSALPDAPIYLLEKEARRLLLQEGLQECLTCDLISPALAAVSLEKGLGEASSIPVLHPSSVDQSVLRACLLPGLLQVLQNNFNRSTREFYGFEVGRIHFKEKEEYKEQSCIGIILSGKNRPHHFGVKPEEVDFFDLKGIVENVLEGLGLPKPSFEPSHLHSLHPWRQAKLVFGGGLTAGALGEVHPDLLQKLSIEQRVYFAEINLHDIFARRKAPRFAPLPSFPGSERDWTITLKESVPIAELFKAIDRARPQILESYFLLDMYQSEQLGKERKNATLRLFYRDLQKTLDVETVDKEHQKLTQAVAEKLHDRIS